MLEQLQACDGTVVGAFQCHLETLATLTNPQNHLELQSAVIRLKVIFADLWCWASLNAQGNMIRFTIMSWHL